MKDEEIHSSPLLSSEYRDSEGDSDRAEQDDIVIRSRATVFQKWYPIALLSSVITLALLVAILIFVVLFRKPTDQQCAAQLSLWSPAMEAVEYVSYDLDNAFDSTSGYRGLPTPEREELWLNLTTQHGLAIPQDKLQALNRADEPNLIPIDGGYLGLIEVFHQLHCLNTIRQYTWLLAGKYDTPPGSLSSSEVGNRMHVDHCIETVRLALMCASDVTPFLVTKAPHSEFGQKADFNSHHKCRNFDKINDWMAEHWTVQ